MAEKVAKSEPCKKVQQLCRLASPTSANVKCLQLNCDRSIMIISTGNKLVHILENYEIQFVLDVESGVFKILDYSSDRGEVFILTNTGKLWVISIPTLIHSREQSNGISESDLQMPHHATKQSSNQETFANLLENNVNIPVSSKSVLPYPVYHCSDKDLIHWEPGIQNVTVSRDYIIVCTGVGSEVKLSIYPWAKAATSSSEKLVVSNLLNQATLPMNLGYCSMNDKVTTMLYVSSDSGRSMSVTSDINEHLFGLMFPTKSGVNVPVVLLGFQSGLLGYIHFGIKAENSNIKTFYHLEQPITAIYVVRVAIEDSTDSSSGAKLTFDSLLILGSLGKLVLIMQESMNKVLTGKIIFREYHVPGPVVCAALNHNQNILFYSTTREVFLVSLKFESKQKGQKWDCGMSSNDFPASLTPACLNISKVVALAFDPVPGAPCLLCMKDTGHVLILKELSSELLGISSARSGEQIKKQLEKMEKKSQAVVQLGDELYQLEDCIRQLNMVTHLFCQILRDRKQQIEATFQRCLESCKESDGISFIVNVEYEALGASSNPRVILKCSLNNYSKISFSDGWSLVVQIAASQPWFNEDYTKQTTVNHSISLSGSPQHHISIPMDCNVSYLNPIQILCYVSFQMKGLIPEFMDKWAGGPVCKDLGLLLSKTELNILHFLRKQEVQLIIHEQNDRPIDLLLETLKNFTASEHSYVNRENSQKPKDSAVSFHLSKEAASFIQEMVKNDADIAVAYAAPESKREIVSVEACVLWFILHGSRSHLCCDNFRLNNGHFVARTPNEEVVEFQVAHIDQEGSMGGFEVLVNCASPNLGCAIHAGLTKLFTPVLERQQKQDATVPVTQIQTQLIKLKEVQASLEVMRPSTALSEPAISSNDKAVGNNVERLISIYNDLRSIPTLIL